MVRLTTPTHISATIKTASEIASSVRDRGLRPQQPCERDPGQDGGEQIAELDGAHGWL